MKKIKTAILGTGFIGSAHIEAIRRLGYVEVVAIAENNVERAASFAKSLNIPKAYGDYMELLQDNEIDAIHNCTPNHLHYEINRQILMHGKHLLSEKPLTLTSDEARDLYHLAKDKDLVTGINFVYRQFPMVQHMRAMVEDNELGDLRLIRGEYMQDWLMNENDYNWRMEPEFGGQTRAIGDIGSHLFDLAQHVTGLKITEVMADKVIVIPKRYKPINGQLTFQSSDKSNSQLVDIVTEDYCSVLVKFENGVRGVFTVSQVSAGNKNALSLSLDGSKASSHWEQQEPSKLSVGYRDKPREIIMRDSNLLKKAAQPFLHYPSGHEEGWTDGLKNSMKHFYEAVIGGKSTLSKSITTFSEGYQIMILIDAIVKSAESGSWQKVDQIN
jgi:predicted dehydrogenase